jgi:hypothetical protein
MNDLRVVAHGLDADGEVVATYTIEVTREEQLANLLVRNASDDELAADGLTRADADAYEAALSKWTNEIRANPTIEVVDEQGTTRTYRLPPLNWSARRQQHVWAIDPVREHARRLQRLSPQLATRRRDERTPRPRPRDTRSRSTRGPPADESELPHAGTALQLSFRSFLVALQIAKEAGQPTFTEFLELVASRVAAEFASLWHRRRDAA